MWCNLIIDLTDTGNRANYRLTDAEIPTNYIRVCSLMCISDHVRYSIIITAKNPRWIGNKCYLLYGARGRVHVFSDPICGQRYRFRKIMCLFQAHKIQKYNNYIKHPNKAFKIQGNCKNYLMN